MKAIWILFCGLFGLVACSSGSDAVGQSLRDAAIGTTWNCTTRSNVGSDTATDGESYTVTINENTATVSPGYMGSPDEVTWDLTGSTLTLRTGNDVNVSGLPTEVIPTGTFTLASSGNSGQPESGTFEYADNKIKISFQSVSGGHGTELTECTKA